MVGLARDRGIATAYVPAVDAGGGALVEGAAVIAVTPVATLAEPMILPGGGIAWPQAAW